MYPSILTTLESMYSGNVAQIDTFITSNREIQQMLERCNDNRNGRRAYNICEYSIEVLQTMYTQNITQIESLLTLNREIQRAIINGPPQTNPNVITYELNMEEPTTTRFSLGRSLFESFMEPVEIRPTQEQIDSATMLVKYGEISIPGNTTCPISLDTFLDEDDVIVIRHCGHIFKPTEFDTWFSSNCRCPTCRYDIRT